MRLAIIIFAIVSSIPSPQLTVDYYPIKYAETSQKPLESVKYKEQSSRQVIAEKPLETSKSSYSGSLANWLLKLRMCESGGNYQTNTGNGYYGAYQFSQATWNHWNTGYAFAHQAPPAVQDATIIKNTNASAGLSTQNPGCYASQGLSNKPPS